MDKDLVVQPEEGFTEKMKRETEDLDTKEEVRKRPKSEAEVRHCLKLNVRHHAKLGAEVMFLLKERDRVEVLREVNPDWTKINANGQVGYVMSRYLARV